MVTVDQLNILDLARKGAKQCQRPNCYAGMDEKDWDAGITQMVVDLGRLAFEDGCVGSAWALSMFAKMGEGA